MLHLILSKSVKLASKENFFFMKICIHVITYLTITTSYIDATLYHVCTCYPSN